MKFLLLHEGKNDDGIRSFFMDVWELYVKVGDVFLWRTITEERRRWRIRSTAPTRQFAVPCSTRGSGPVLGSICSCLAIICVGQCWGASCFSSLIWLGRLSSPSFHCLVFFSSFIYQIVLLFNRFSSHCHQRGHPFPSTYVPPRPLWSRPDSVIPPVLLLSAIITICPA